MKRIFTFLLVITLVLSTTLAASAEEVVTVNEPSISQEKAVEIAKQTVKKGWNYSISDEIKPEVKLVPSTVDFVNDYYVIYWDMLNQDPSLSIKTAIDAETGFARYTYFNDYSNYNHLESEQPLNMYSASEAQKMAENFIKKMFPNKYKEVELVSNSVASKFTGYIEYNYVFYRKLNNAYVHNNYIKVSIYSDTKDISSYSCHWYDLEFESTKSAINQSQAVQAVKQALPLSLVFKPVNELTNYTNNLYLTIYDTLVDNGYAVDAFTGDIIDVKGNKIDTTKLVEMSTAQKDAILKHEVDIKGYSEPVTREQATTLANNYLKDIYGEGYQILSLNLIDKSNELTSTPYVWHAVFEKANSNDSTIGQIKINSLTERLLYATINNNTDDTSDFSFEKGYEIALNMIKSYYSDKLNELKTSISYTDKSEPTFIFTRQVNDVLYPYNGVAITVDPQSYKVMQASFTWDNSPPKKPENTINVAIATKNYFSEYEPELYYVMINTSTDKDNPNYELKLVYDLPENYYSGNIIDAANGFVLNKKATAVVKKDNVNLETDQLLTKFEALSIILKDKSSYYADLNQDLEYDDLKFTDLSESNEYYDYVKSAYMLGMIENKEADFNGDEYLTREELAEILVNRLGLNDAAKLSNIYRLNIADQSKISKEKYGYVALAYGYGILQTETSKLDPQGYATKLDLYIAINNVNRALKN